MTSRFLCRVQRYQKCEAGFISRGYNHRDLWANMQTEVIIQFLLPSRSQKKEKNLRWAQANVRGAEKVGGNFVFKFKALRNKEIIILATDSFAWPLSQSVKHLPDNEGFTSRAKKVIYDVLMNFNVAITRNSRSPIHWQSRDIQAILNHIVESKAADLRLMLKFS